MSPCGESIHHNHEQDTCVSRGQRNSSILDGLMSEEKKATLHQCDHCGNISSSFICDAKACLAKFETVCTHCEKPITEAGFICVPMKSNAGCDVYCTSKCEKAAQEHQLFHVRVDRMPCRGCDKRKTTNYTTFVCSDSQVAVCSRKCFNKVIKQVKCTMCDEKATGTFVPESKSVQDTTWVFCSDTCRARLAKRFRDQRRYIKKQAWQVEPMTCHCCDAKNSKRTCSGCSTVIYCGDQCQRSHWPAHKSLCLRIQAGNKVLESVD